MKNGNIQQIPQLIRRHSAVKEIIDNEVFLSMKDFRHHGDVSCLEHTLQVAARACHMTRIRPGIDVISTVRAALLHDFYLYDWHTDSPGLHGLRHPHIALINAEKHFTLNDVERDAIKRHMWPLTPVPPRYRESYIVSMADKLITFKDYTEKMVRHPEEEQREQIAGSA